MRFQPLLLTIALLLLVAVQLIAAEPKAGNRVEINDPVEDDLYLAGDEVIINAPVRGDVIVACNTLTIRDSIFGDLIAAMGQVNLSGYVGDDIRVFGGQLKISTNTGGDLIIFGGEVTLNEGVRTGGDVVVFGGTVDINGTIEGGLRAYGGEIDLNGTVAQDAELRGGEININGPIRGNTILVAQKLELGSDAQFAGSVRYWTSTGEVDFGGTASDPQFDDKLKPDTGGGFGGWGFFILGFLSSVLLALLLIFVFSRYFERGAAIIQDRFVRSFGFGVLYVIGMPVVLFILMITVIGLPIGLLGLSFYIFTLIFAPTIAAVVLAYWLDHRYDRNWNRWMLLLVAAGIFIVLALVIMIPFIGGLIGIVVIGTAIGALLQSGKGRAEPAMEGAV